jgi:hypothetical protein
MLLFQMSLDLVRLYRIHTILVCEHLLFFRIMEILYSTRAIGYRREPRLVARSLRVAFGLRVMGCGLWVWGAGSGCRLWVIGCGLRVTGYRLRVAGYRLLVVGIRFRA